MSKKESNLKIVSEAHTDQKEKQKALDAAISQIDSNFGKYWFTLSLLFEI